MSLLIANNIQKTFVIHKKEGLLKTKAKTITAINSFSLEIEKPMIIGLIGPNGAGKTTFIKHCLGLVKKSAGELEVLGFDPYTGEPLSPENKAKYKNQNNWISKINRALGGNYNKSPFLKQVGLVSGQKQNLDHNLSALDSLRLSGYLYDMNGQEIENKISELVARFKMEMHIDTPVRQLSLGQRMKFEIISSVIHSPTLLFMDEPSLGLDFEAQSMMREILLELHQSQNLTILLTSHYLPDITSLCSRVAVIENGQKVYDGGVNDLIQKTESEGYLKTLIQELNNKV